LGLSVSRYAASSSRRTFCATKYQNCVLREYRSLDSPGSFRTIHDSGPGISQRILRNASLIIQEQSLSTCHIISKVPERLPEIIDCVVFHVHKRLKVYSVTL